VAAIVPVHKRLVADLTALRRRMQRDADAGAATGEPLKLEGLAIVDERHVAIVNDNDFAVPQAGTGTPRRSSRLWIVELPVDLSSLAAAVP
jgi:antitoxin (DNA-binding transcriptional repressor) of toxin-antitoxin stability system